MTKVVASFRNRPGAKLKAMKKWFGPGITRDETFRREILDFIVSRGATGIVLTRGVMGCPHEEVKDYPRGEACPQCPLWASRDRFETANPLILHLEHLDPSRRWPGVVENN